MRQINILILLLLLCSGLMGRDIGGFWQTIDDKTHKPNSIVAIYAYQGKYYGRMIATYNDKGEIDDTIYNPKGRAPGIVGNPYYCGLDFVLAASCEPRP